VAWIVTLLTPNPSTSLLQAALLHDVGEQWTGDVPATAKWAHRELQIALLELEDWKQQEYDLVPLPLTAEEDRVLKQADMLDLCFKMIEELSMGNQQCVDILTRGITYLWENQPLPMTKELLNKLEELCPTLTANK
jgi:5'-deoxynucleotidase YfbR-like HD superfamily hydrolase